MNVPLSDTIFTDRSGAVFYGNVAKVCKMVLERLALVGMYPSLQST